MHAQPLPIRLTGINVEITNQPKAPAWTFAGWAENAIEGVTHAYVFYAGDLYDEANQAIDFELELKFTTDNQDGEDYKIIKLGEEVIVKDGVDEHTVSPFKVSATTSPSINFTISSSEEESSGVVHFLPVHMMEVSFGGDSYHELKSDDLAVTYSAPQWKDTDGNGPERNHSVAYTKGTKPKIGAKLKIKGMPANVPVHVRALWDGKTLIESTPGDIIGEEVVLPITKAKQAKEPFPDKIGFYQKGEDTAYKIQWQISVDDDHWGDVKTTKHQVYVTKTAPAESIVHNRETLFYLACNKAAEDGLDGSNLLLLTNSIYKNFQSLEISSVDTKTGKPDGVFLKFWGPGSAPSHILVDKTEVCGGWSDFLIEVLSIHRISAEKVNIGCKNQMSWNTNVASLNKKAYRFFLKPCNVPQSAAYSQQWEDALPKVPAQGHNTHRKAWPVHTIVHFEIDDNIWYYDPSYGIGPCNGLLKYNDSLAGFVDLDGTWLWQPDGIHLDIKLIE